MTVATIDPQNSHVVLVAERHSLHDTDSHAGSIRGPRVGKSYPQRGHQKSKGPHDARSGDDVHPAGKHLRHRRTLHLTTDPSLRPQFTFRQKPYAIILATEHRLNIR